MIFASESMKKRDVNNQNIIQVNHSFFQENAVKLDVISAHTFSYLSLHMMFCTFFIIKLVTV